MKRATLTILIGLIWTLTFAQVDATMTDTTKSVYKGLITKKFYNIGYSSSSTNGVTVYKMNDKEVTKSNYDKYHNTWKNMETCKPCILETYDINNKLLKKGIQYTDCPVGFWIEYFPNGKVKLIAHYKENENGDWNNAWDRGFCRPDGAFTYFNDRGQKLYTEYWREGQFIKQIPEQAKTELWNVALTIGSVKVDKQILTPKQVGEIKITPQFKNSLTAGTNITIKFEISAVGHKQISGTFGLDNFKTIDVQKMLDEIGIKSPETASCTMIILNNGVNVFNYWLTVKP
jgi:antitoxin component YwqK of YwqJK toxin-antitoxin module